MITDTHDSRLTTHDSRLTAHEGMRKIYIKEKVTKPHNPIHYSLFQLGQ